MLFSIITVCLNSEKTIGRAIESVLNQDFQDYEYIIIDGKSTDNTLKIIESYKKKIGNKLTVISEKDKGIYDAMNKGILISKGKYIGIVNSDDYYEKDTLLTVSKYASNNPYHLIYGNIRVFFDNKKAEIRNNRYENIEKNMIQHPACFISKSIFTQYGLYSLKYKYSADYEFLLRIRNYTNIKITKIDKILSNYYASGVSSTAKGYRDTLMVRNEYNLINSVEYMYQMVKTKIAIFFNK